MRTSRIARPIRGQDTCDALAHKIAEAEGFDKLQEDQLLDRARRAIIDGHLRTMDPEIGLRTDAASQRDDLSPLVSVDDFNDWLSAEGATYRVQDPRQAQVTAAPVRHSTKAVRRDTLDPVIDYAKGKCLHPEDTAEVWAQMEKLAQEEHAPLLAATSDGLKYTKNGRDAYFKRDALDKRLHPEKRRSRR